MYALTYRPSSRTQRTIDVPLYPQLHLIDVGVTEFVPDSEVVDMISSRCRSGDSESVAGIHKLMNVVIFDPNKAFPGLQDHPVIVDCVLHGLSFKVSSF